MRLFSLLIILLVFLPFNVQSQESDYQLREMVKTRLSEEYSDLHFAMLSEISKNDLRIAIFWPCIMNGNFIDDDIVGYAFKKENNEWIFKEELSLSRGGKEKITAITGSTDFKVTKPNGLEIDSLSLFIYNNAKEIKDSLRSDNGYEIARLIEGLSRAFSLDICGYDDAYAELIIKGLFAIKQMEFSEIKISGNKATANVLLPWDVKQKIEFIKVESGWTISQIE